MREMILRFYVRLFAKRRFSGFNRFLFRLSLGGLGILNYKSSAESGELSFLRQYLPGKLGALIDVGANTGNYSKEALKFNNTMQVYAFEPHPKTFTILQQTLGEYKNVMTLNQGLSSTSGTLKLYDYSNRDGSQHASLFREVISDLHRSDSIVSHEVELTTLDAFISTSSINEISLLKIDTEGNELEVLEGARNTLSRGIIKAIHFEFNEMNVVSRTFFRDFEKILSGYRLFRLLPNDMLEIEEYHALDCEIFAYQNFVAILDEA